MELREAIDGGMQSQYDAEMLMDCAYHEVLTAAAQLDGDADPAQVWGPGFAWSRFVATWKARQSDLSRPRRLDSYMSA